MTFPPATRSLPSANLWRLALGLVLLALASGCGGKGGSSGDKGTVKGKLTVKGAAPAAGTVLKLISADGKESSAAVDADGSFTVGDVPVGEVKVAVVAPTTSSSVVGGGAMPGIAGGGKGAAVPPKYATPGTYPNFTVNKGENQKDIDLAP